MGQIPKEFVPSSLLFLVGCVILINKICLFNIIFVNLEEVYVTILTG